MSNGPENEEIHKPDEDENSEKAREIPVDDSDQSGEDEKPGKKELSPEEEAEKWRDQALRNRAELENFRKRMAREKAEAIKYANAAVLEGLLPILDNFKYGMEAARQESEQSVVFQGMSMVMKQFQDFLADQGVTPVPSEGAPFDPNLHEAVEQRHSDEHPEGTIVATTRQGYRLHDRLLRAANVIVSKGPEDDARPTENGDS